MSGAAVVGCVALVVTLLASLPYWLPAAVVRLRMRIFTRINGDEGIAVPGARVDATRFKWLYSHPAASGRSRGAALSDLFWYWLSPGAELHQEHLEPGPRHDEVAAATRRILAVPKASAEALASRCMARALDPKPSRPARAVRLRDEMMPVWAEFFHELVFAAPCSAAARELIVGNADDVVSALKCCRLRHMPRRDRLTRFLVAEVERGAVPHRLPDGLSTLEQALYLQGVFFNTAVVQMSEASAHLLLAIAQNDDVQRRLTAAGDDRYLEHVIAETLRLYPLFGISHRITSDDIALDDGERIAKGSVVCFNHPEFHRSGFADAERFDPDRWQTLAARDANYVPFGVAANRPCPAQVLSLVALRAAARLVLDRYSLHSTASHTRSLLNRGPCVLVARGSTIGRQWLRARLAVMRLRDRWEDVGRSLVQLILGTAMVLDARRLRLCERHFSGKAA